MNSFFFDYQMPLFDLLLEMSWRGVRIDLERLERVKRVLTFLLERKRRVFESLAPGVNPRSPKQLVKLLYEDLGLPKQKKKGKEGKVTTDENALKTLAKKSDNPVLAALLAIRELEKKKGTYAEVVLSGDGRLRTQYRITGTETGRLSSRMTDEEEGANLQNIPPWFRKLIVPDEGKVFVEGDGSQAEARIVAWEAEDEEMMEVFKDPKRNIHKLNASRLFGIPEEEVEKDSAPNKPYGKAKRLVHAFDYGVGVNTAAETAGVSVAEARLVREKYFRGFPKIVKWQEEVRRLTEGKYPTMVTPLGRRRVFLGRRGYYASDNDYKRGIRKGQWVANEELVRKMLASDPQSTCVDYILMGMVRARKRLPEGAEFLLQTHDGHLTQCFPKDVGEVQVVLKESTCVPILIRGRELVIPMEFKVGKLEQSWGDL